jgi:acyl-CoA reductase-like NAD-dependent aldehyde dehydrogenase
LAVSKFKTEEEAVRLANGVKYGLAGSIFTNDLKRAHRIAARIKAGQVYINTYFNKGLCETPGCGWKERGSGGAGIYNYMHPKVVAVDLN